MDEMKQESATAIDIPPELVAMRKKSAKRKWLGIALAVLLIVLTAVAVWNCNVFTLKVSLQGSDALTVEYGDAYLEPGAQAVFRGSLLCTGGKALEVQIQGEVDENTLGTYELTYTATKTVDYLFGKLEFSDTAVRTVTVADTKAPALVLLKDPDYFTLPGHEYEEEGYAASDNHDGGLTDQVKRWQDGDWVFYQVTDASGNMTMEKRQIIYSDPIAPELILEGKEDYIVVVGNKYKEPGFAAIDNFDGDITEKVTVTGTVDHKTLGTYPLEYTVTDSFGNETKVTRNVTVREYPELPTDLFPGQAQEPVKPEGKVIYLTFDDGPCTFTPYLLNVLKKYDVKATFFVVNRGNHEVLKRIAEEGHTLAMHCGTHTYRKIYASEEAYFKDLKEIQDVIYEVTGQKSTIVRFPGGTGNTVSSFNPGIMTRLTKMLDAMGYRVFDWNVSSSDSSTSKTKEDVYNKVIERISGRKISVVLQHDIKFWSVDAVEDIIKWGLKNGYTFLPLSNDSPKCQAKPRN